MSHLRASRERYKGFVEDYKRGRLGEGDESAKDAAPPTGLRLGGRQREYLPDLLRRLPPPCSPPAMARRPSA